MDFPIPPDSHSAIRMLCYLFSRQCSLALTPDQHNFISHACLRNVCYIDHTLINADTTKDRCLLPMDKHGAPGGRGAAETIGVANWQDGYMCRACGYINTTITDAFAGG